MSTEKKSKFAIVNTICALLNLGEFGKIENFISKTVRVLKNEVEDYKRNIATNRYIHKGKFASMQEDLEDAEQALEDAYNHVQTERLGSNADIKKYREEYLADIYVAETNVEAVKESIESDKKMHEKVLESDKDEIKWREVRINKLVKSSK
jgi:hypothetical protein